MSRRLPLWVIHCDRSRLPATSGLATAQGHAPKYPLIVGGRCYAVQRIRFTLLSTHPAELIVERERTFLDLGRDIFQGQFAAAERRAGKHEIKHVLVHARIADLGAKAAIVAPAGIRTGRRQRFVYTDRSLTDLPDRAEVAADRGGDHVLEDHNRHVADRNGWIEWAVLCLVLRQHDIQHGLGGQTLPLEKRKDVWFCPVGSSCVPVLRPGPAAGP